MFISWVLAAFFILMILGEMYFIGKYISASQGIFNDKTFASFALGAALYIFVSLLCFAPFATINLPKIYYAVILMIKDFFTAVFLIARREKFKGMRLNWRAIIAMMVAASALPVFFEYVTPYIYDQENVFIKNDFQTWNRLYVPAFTDLTKFDLEEVKRYIFAPIASVVVYSCVSALFLNFYNRERAKAYAISLLLTFGFVLLFNFRLHIYDMMGMAMILFAFLSAYNLIMFSRRRYGALFGVLVASTWSLMPQLFWAMLILAMATSITYSYLRKPKAAIFALQLIIPIMIVAALWVSSVSRGLALALAIAGLVLYILIFVVNRFKILEDSNKWTHVFNIAWPIIVIVTMITMALVYGFTHNEINEKVLFNENVLFDKFSNDSISGLVQNVMYYVLFLFLAVYTTVVTLRKDRILKLKLTIILVFFAFLFGYNPAFQAIMMANGWEKEFEYTRLAATAPLAIVAISQIKILKNKA